jgi:hypothetical protein
MIVCMTVDSQLPSVGYVIRLQRVLNEFFIVLMCLVLEACSVNILRESYGVSDFVTQCMDCTTRILASSHNIWTLSRYYHRKHRAQERLDYGLKKKTKEE